MSLKIAIIGGGPAGLYFGILWKQVEPASEIVVFERNRADDTFGFGVVFSDATLARLAAADPISDRAIRQRFAHWDDIDIHVGGERFRSTGHGFCGLERRTLLTILQARARELGVELRFEREAPDVEVLRREFDLVLGADGVASAVRQRDAVHFGPEIDERPNRFVWLGTSFPFPAFTFYFKPSEHGLFRVHAYRYREDGSTFIVECTADTFDRTGLRADDEDATIAYLERLFAAELAGHRLRKNRSIWRRFPVVRVRRWSHGNVVLLGDAVHTAHFSIGSGTKLAMEDAIALRDALVAAPDVTAALARYEAERRPPVEALQRAAQVSLEWFEHTERYVELAPVQFAFSLLTRSLRVTHDNLARRDGELCAAVDAWFAAQAGLPPRPPRQVPLTLRGLTLPNRVVSDGLPRRGAGLAIVRPGEVAAARGGAVGVRLASDDPAATTRALAAGADLIALDHAGPAEVAALRGRIGDRPLAVWVAGAPDAAAHARRLADAGMDLAIASGDRLAALALADRLRNEAGVLTACAGLSSADDLDTALCAGRADLGLVAPGVDPGLAQ